MNWINLLPEFLLPYLSLIRLALAVVVFLVFWATKKPITRMISKLVCKLLNHRKTWIKKESIDNTLVPCHSIIALIGLYLAFSICGLSQNLFVYRCFRIVMIALIAWAVTRFWDASADWVFSANENIGKQLNLSMGKTLRTFLTKAVKLIIVVLAAITILNETGADVTALITGLGLGGLTFALAAQDTASNLFSGLVILLDRPFSVEDWIQTPSIEGIVEDITFRSTRIRTFTNAQVVVPNSSLTSQPITNWSRMEKRRVTFSIGVEYGTTSTQISRCIARIEELLNHHPDVVENSAVVSFNAFLDSSLEISVLYFSKETGFAAYQKVKEDINLKIMAIVEEEGCSFAFPTQTLHIEKTL